MDRRDETSWVTLELTKAGEAKALDGTLAKAIRHDLRVPDDFPVFIPYAPFIKNAKNVSVLIEGYAFVSSGLPETKYFHLESKSLVSRVLSARGPNGMRILHTIPNHKVMDMKDQLRVLVSSDVEVGMTVRITGGCYARIEGVVVDVYDEKVAVRVPLRSIDIITVIPKALLNLDPDEPIDVPSDLESYEDHVSSFSEMTNEY